MIRKERQELVATCSACEETKYYGGVQDDFRAFVGEIKDAGWMIRKEGDEWIHLCPDCEGA